MDCPVKVEVSISPNQSSVHVGDGCGQGFYIHQSEFCSCWRWVWPRFLYTPIRVLFMFEMGVAKVSIYTNQSSVYAWDGCGRGFYMHQSEFSLLRRWVWLRFLCAPIKVQFMPSHGLGVQGQEAPEIKYSTSMSSTSRRSWKFTRPANTYNIKVHEFRCLIKLSSGIDGDFWNIHFS